MIKLVLFTRVSIILENLFFSFSDFSACHSITLFTLKLHIYFQQMLKNNYHFFYKLWYSYFNSYSIYAFNYIGANKTGNCLLLLFKTFNQSYQVSCKEKIMLQGNTHNILSKWGSYGIRNFRSWI